MQIHTHWGSQQYQRPADALEACNPGFNSNKVGFNASTNAVDHNPEKYRRLSKTG